MKRQTKFWVIESKAPQNWKSYIYDIGMLTFYWNKDDSNIDAECRILDDDIYKQILKNILKNKQIYWKELLGSYCDLLFTLTAHLSDLRFRLSLRYMGVICDNETEVEENDNNRKGLGNGWKIFLIFGYVYQHGGQ